MEELNKKQTDGTDKVVYTVSELMALGDFSQKYLLEPILPQIGSGVLVGKPDTGKSQFARQICIHIALGIDEFLGFRLSPSVNKAIYVATEDDINSVKFLLNKQFHGINKDYNDNLRFVFADTLDQNEIRNTLENELKEKPVSLVIIDSYGDIFNGQDSNNNMAMRNTAKAYDKIAKQHNCLILFVHHINKKGYGSTPSQQHVQGGSGLTQKVRIVLQLSEGLHEVRYLTVIKGNYCPKKYKSESLELNFSEDTFLFTSTGRFVQTDQIGSNNKKSRSDRNLKNEINLIQEIIKKDSFTNTDLVNQYIKRAHISVRTAQRKIKKLVEESVLIKNNDGTYSFNNKLN